MRTLHAARSIRGMPLKVIAEFPSMPEAQIAASVLESAGIVAVMMDGPNIALNPLVQLRTGFRLAVSEDDVFTAQRILEAAREEGEDG